MMQHKAKAHRSRRRFLSNIAILSLLGMCLIALSLYLWKVQESRNLSQIGVTAESKARSYARETETRYGNILQALTRLASRGIPHDEEEAADWEEDAVFYIDAFEGFRSIAWVDDTFRIRQIVPIGDNETYLGQVASSIESTAADVRQWLPIAHDGEFEGFVLAVVNIASLISPVLWETADDYILQLSDEGVLIFESEEWDHPQQGSLIFETITLQDATVLQMAFAPTAELLQSSAAAARRTLAFSLLLSVVAVIAVYFARNYSASAILNRLRYRNLFEASQDAIFIIDLQGKYQDANPAATRMVGYSVAELRNMTIDDLRSPEETPSRVMPSRMWTEGGTAELSLRSREGHTIPVELSISPIMEGGTQTLVLGIARDITMRKRAEAEKLAAAAHLRQGQKLESIGTLASGVAHEVNNPLMGIINYAELLRDKVDDEQGIQYTDGIIKEGNRVATITRNLLAFSRQDKETHSPADLRDIIDVCLSLVGATLRRDQITIEVVVPDTLPKVKCRSQQIEQVIINLLTNARDALNLRYPEFDENKTLSIKVRQFERDSEPWITIAIEDHGVGIHQDVIERIFDPFFTTKPRDEGTGLGLSVSYGIVKEHMGKLTVESEVGVFSRFHINLRVNNGWLLRDDKAGT